MMTASHQPPDYACPFCSIVAGQDNEGNWTKQSDVVLRAELATAFVSSQWWPGNYGHVLVVPNGHFENVYAIPDDYLAAVQIAGKRIAIAMKATYGCDGTSFRQHNEPAGNQDVWHYHLHVFPRYVDDELYRQRKERRSITPVERLPYAQKLREYLAGG
jgi:histidine triad (HIT) family protein